MGKSHQILLGKKSGGGSDGEENVPDGEEKVQTTWLSRLDLGKEMGSCLGGEPREMSGACPLYKGGWTVSRRS